MAGGKGTKRKFTIIIEQGPTSYGAYVQELPGCVAVALTPKAVLKLIKEAIVFHLRGLEEDGQPVPKLQPK
ncbi:MAG: type II toxin-antitoxin system HicB family antitoxin [Planctomycetota bacterium]